MKKVKRKVSNELPSIIKSIHIATVEDLGEFSKQIKIRNKPKKNIIQKKIDDGLTVILDLNTHEIIKTT